MVDHGPTDEHVTSSSANNFGTTESTDGNMLVNLPN